MKKLSKERKSAILFIVIALILGLLAVVITYTSINKHTKKAPILIAKDYIGSGDPLNNDMFEIKYVPIAGRQKDAVNPSLNLEEYLTITELVQNDVLRMAHIASTENMNVPLMSSRLRSLEKKEFGELNKEENKLRAVEIPIDSITGILPAMKVGDKIVVTSVFIEEGKNEEKLRVTDTIFDYIDVIGIRIPVDNAKGNLAIALTQKQFEAFALAREKGKFFIAIMPFGIEKPVNHPEIISQRYIDMLKNPEVMTQEEVKDFQEDIQTTNFLNE